MVFAWWGKVLEQMLLSLISGKALLENCDNSIPMKETRTASVFDAVPDAVPETEQRDWKKRGKTQ